MTVCCEEGRHRSVAFVEELGRRLSLLRNGLDSLSLWKLTIAVSHRDLGVSVTESDPTSHQVGPSRAKTRQRGSGKDVRRFNQKNRNGLVDDGLED